MNILENIAFNTDKPSVVQVKNSDKIKYFAVGLGNGAVLKKHSTAVPTTVTVLKGEINIIFSDREYTLKEFDIFDIPVDEVHEVVGILASNLFTVTKEL